MVAGGRAGGQGRAGQGRAQGTGHRGSTRGTQEVPGERERERKTSLPQGLAGH